jgi:hypothetical protein
MTSCRMFQTALAPDTTRCPEAEWLQQSYLASSHCSSEIKCDKKIPQSRVIEKLIARQEFRVIYADRIHKAGHNGFFMK